MYLLVLIVRAILSWFPVAYDSPVQRVRDALDVVTEPVLRPLRRVMPPLQVGGVGLDMSFLVLFFLILVLESVICGGV